MFNNLFLERLFLFIYRKYRLVFTIVFTSVNSTYSSENRIVISNVIKKNILNKKNNIKCINEKLLNNYLSHKFNLLGSGLKIFGLKKVININYQNKKVSQTLLKKIKKNYKRLDWQKDFKSNYRWDENKLSRRLNFMNIPRADIKLPWEFSRMQHSTQMAIYAAKIKKINFNKSKEIFEEFKNQILDFISSNPPEYGANWICTMDVSIRISNLLIAKDIFNSIGFAFSNEQESIFKNTLADHRKFILKNLEYSSYRNNHYLSNICALAVIAKYHQQDVFSDNLIAFVSQELNKEIFIQFNEDGSNIEGSTSYHKFSLEMILYATSFILSFEASRLKKIKKNIKSNYIKTSLFSPKLNKKNFKLYKINNRYFENKFLSLFPERYFERLIKMFNFFLKTTTNSKQIIQVGDNDSGKFFNFTPIFYNQKINNISKKNYFENRESVNYILDIADSWGLYKNFNSINNVSFEKQIIKILLGKIRFKSTLSKIKNTFKLKNYSNYKKHIKFLRHSILKNRKFREVCYEFKANEKIMKNLELSYFKNFGIFIWKNEKIFFSLRAISKYDKRFTTHYHFDQLSNILIINNKNLIIDPGTFIYNGNLKHRNYFRSYSAHFSPINIILKKDIDIFSKIDHPNFETLIIGKFCYLVKVSINNKIYYSGYIYEKNKIKIFHISNEKISKYKQKKYYSPGYGLLKYPKSYEKISNYII
jgi:hypothetical protein